MTNRFAVSTALSAGLAALLCAAWGCGQKKDSVLARVGSDPITASEFKQELSRQPFAREEYISTLPGKKELLELMVRRKLMLAESHRNNLTQKPEVKERLKELEEEFERQLREARERVVVGEFLRELQQKDLKVTDEEVKHFWETESEARASHILLPTDAEARQVLAELTGGAKFEALAKEHSQDKASAAKGGDLGFFMPGTLVPEFEKAVFTLKTGETSGVVSSPYGHHIIRKTGEQKISERPFEQAGGLIRSVLEKRKFQDWMEKAKTRYNISLDLQALESLSVPQAPEAGPLPQRQISKTK